MDAPPYWKQKPCEEQTSKHFPTLVKNGSRFSLQRRWCHRQIQLDELPMEAILGKETA